MDPEPTGCQSLDVDRAAESRASGYNAAIRCTFAQMNRSHIRLRMSGDRVAQEPQPQAPLAVEMRGIVKRFPGVVANDGIDLSVRQGEIHALLGENGAGKSTLMNILMGLYPPDGGQILIDGSQVHFHSPRDASNAGLGMVHQHFMLISRFTVTENVILGNEGPSITSNRQARRTGRSARPPSATASGSIPRR